MQRIYVVVARLPDNELRVWAFITFQRALEFMQTEMKFGETWNIKNCKVQL